MAYENMHIHTKAMNIAWKLDPCKMGIQNAIPGFCQYKNMKNMRKKELEFIEHKRRRAKKIVQRKDNFFSRAISFF